MSNFVWNEHVKMASTLFNNLGVVSFATGAINPLVLGVFHPFNPSPLWESIVALVLGGIGCVVFAGIAQWFLMKLKEEEPSYPSIEKVYPHIPSFHELPTNVPTL